MSGDRGKPKTEDLYYSAHLNFKIKVLVLNSTYKFYQTINYNGLKYFSCFRLCNSKFIWSLKKVKLKN